jgi:hypothetical protein
VWSWLSFVNSRSSWERVDSRLADVEKFASDYNDGALYWKIAGSKFAKYDCATPEKALKSYVKMKADKDVWAMAEYQSRLSEANDREMATSLKVNRAIECEGKVLLLVSYQKGGIATYETFAMEKDASSGLWSVSSTWGIKDEKVRKIFEEWNQKGNQIADGVK